MLQYGESGDYKWNFALRKFPHQSIAMPMRAVQHRKIAPSPASSANALDLSGHPPRLVLDFRQFHHANLFSFCPVRGEHFLRKIRARRVHSDHLARHPQDVRRRTVILRQAHAKRRRILAFAPSREALQKKLEAAEGCAPESVNGLVVVAYGKDIPAVVGQKLQQAQLRDVRVLEFVNQYVAIPVLQGGPKDSVTLKKLDGAGNQ